MPKPLHSWRSDLRFANASHKNFRLVLFAVLVGVLAGLVGSFFRLLLDQVNTWRMELLIMVDRSDVLTWWAPVLFSVVGILVAWYMVRRWAPEAAGSGVQEIEGALDEIRPIRWKRVLPVKFFGSLFSLGSGMLLGREGPTIQMGANLGKMVKDVFKLTEDHSNPLISSGAAAGLAAAFNAPFAGAVFVMEEMHGHFKYTFYSVAAIMVASASADVVVRFFTGVDPVIRMAVYGNQNLDSLWLFVLLGLIFSLLGLFFNKLLIWVLDLMSVRLAKYRLMVLITMGVVIAVVAIFEPGLTGGGYMTIAEALQSSFVLKTLAFFLVVRFFLTIFSYGTGTPGGIFAPMLVLGVLMGMLFGGIMQHYFPHLISDPGVFAVAGMAAIFASTVRAPLTGIALAIEMTANYELILPLIIVTSVASVMTAQMGNQPIYTTLLKRTLNQNTHKST